MKKLIFLGIFSAITTLIVILVTENTFVEKSVETRDESIKKIVNHQEKTIMGRYDLR